MIGGIVTVQLLGVSSNPGRFTRVLDRAALFRGYPRAGRNDNGPEFTSLAFMAWTQAHDIRHILIQPRRPIQNCYIESFNGKFRDEQLNECWFQTLHQARKAVAVWHTDYDEVRQHSSLGRMPPARFAEQHRRTFNPGLPLLIGKSTGGRSVGVDESKLRCRRKKS